MNARVGILKKDGTLVIEFDKSLDLPIKVRQGILGGRRLMYHSVPFDFETMIKVQIDAIKGSLDTPLGDETDAHTD